VATRRGAQTAAAQTAQRRREMEAMTQNLPEKKQDTAHPTWPVTDVETLVEGMRRVLDQAYTDVTRWPAVRYGDMWTPAVDVEETDGAYVLEAELPGVHRKDVEIEIIGSELSISGEVKEKEPAGVVRRQARRTGRFSYQITLPEAVNADEIDASLREGVLKVTVPKSERAQRRKIELKA
jgi:HSP20 family protein